MKINIGDFVENKPQNIAGQVMEIIGTRVVIIDDASEADYPDNCVEFDLNELDTV